MYAMSSCSFVVTINVGHVYSSPRTRGFWEVCQLRETPVPSVWVRAQSSQTCGASLFKASSQRTLNYQIRLPHPVNPLCSQIALMQSWDCENFLRILKIGVQFPDSEITQIPRLRGTYIRVNSREEPIDYGCPLCLKLVFICKWGSICVPFI